MSKGVNKVLNLYTSGMSIPQVSDCVGLSMSTVRHHLKKAGVLRSRAEGVRLAAAEGRIGKHLKGSSRVFTPEHCKAISRGRLAAAEKFAKGHRVTPSGYVEYTRGQNKGRGEHRVVMECYLGRSLERHEHVHHIDGDKQNNRLDNLQVMTISEHMAHHAREQSKNRRRNSDGKWS